jgi:hypothetical protein
MSTFPRLERQPLVVFRLTPVVFPDGVGDLLQHAGAVIEFFMGEFFVSVQNPQAAFQLFKGKLVGCLVGFHTPDEIRNRQPDLDFLFAKAGEVEIEGGFDLGRDRYTTRFYPVRAALKCTHEVAVLR